MNYHAHTHPNIILEPIATWNPRKKNLHKGAFSPCTNGSNILLLKYAAQ